MHLFLYQAPRHATTRWGTRRRYVQGTIRGDFNLDVLRYGIKGAYTLLPHGQHEFQEALKGVELQEEFYGHIFTITEAKHAVWFKLNYDQVGKEGTKYMGGWGDLKAQDIQQHITDFRRLTLEEISINEELNYMGGASYMSNGLGRYSMRIENLPQLADEYQKLVEASEVFQLKVRSERNKIDNRLRRVQKAKADVQNEVRAYMKSKKL